MILFSVEDFFFLSLVTFEGAENLVKILGLAVPAGFADSTPSTSQQQKLEEDEVTVKDEDDDMELDLNVKEDKLSH